MDKDEETKDQLSVDLSLEQNIHLAQQLLTDLIESEGVQCETMFNSQSIPPISIEAYLRRIHKYTHYSSQCPILSIIYIDRYNMAVPDFSLNWHNVHRLLLTCLILAVKFQDDIYFDNYSFERGGGIATSQLMQFELELFQKLDYTVFVEQQEYEALLQKLYNVYATQQ